MSIKKIILSCVIILTLLILLSRYIPNNIVPLSGENQYSFSYSGHIEWILKDWTKNPDLLLFDSHKCTDCQQFGMYSRWVMLWLYVFLLPAEILSINPLLWYMCLNFLLQYFGLRYYLQCMFPKNTVAPLTLVFLVLFFITTPYKYLQFALHWEYPFIYMLFFILIGTSVRFIRNGVIKRQEMIITSIASILIFNVAINHLPIIFYMLLSVFLITILKHKDKYKTILQQFIIILLPSLLINSPMILSLLKNNNIPTYSKFISFQRQTIFSFGYLIHTHSDQFLRFSAYIGISILMLGYAFLSKKEFVTIVKILLIGMLLGLLGSSLLFKFIFDNVPLFHTFRSSFRFIIFSQISLITALAYIAIKIKANVRGQYIYFFFFFGAIFLNFLYIFSNLNYLNLISIPSSYEQMYKKIRTDETRRYLYFPTHLPEFGSISTDFYFGKYNGIFYWWQNPFESWYPLRNTLHPTTDLTNEKLRYITYDMYSQNRQKELIQLLRSTDVSCIIIDKYYKWSQKVPYFDLDQFTKQDDVFYVTKFGSLELYCLE